MTMRRVLHVWNKYGDRSETWLHRRLAGLRRWEAHLLTRSKRLTEAARREQPWPDDRLLIWPDHSRLALLISKVRAQMATLDWWAPNYPLAADHLRHLLERNHFDLVNFHVIGASFWPAVQSLRRKQPVVMSFYGSDVFAAGHKKSLRRRMERLCGQAGLAYTVSSAVMAEALLGFGADPEGVHIIPVGVNASDFPSAEAVAARHSGRNGALRIITVGRLAEVKAPQELPGVLRRVLDAGVDARWLVAGEGPLRPEIEAAVRRHGVGDRFTLAGEMPFAGVRDALLDSDVMVHNAVVTSEGRRESLGVVLMEAGAMGLPVVSCRVGGIPEVVLDGRTGVLVPEGDGGAMAEAIVQLARDPEERRRMGLAAAEHVRTHFDNDVLARRIEDLYDRLMDEPRG